MYIGLKRRRNRSLAGQRVLAAAMVETLEARQLLSASVTVHVYNDPSQNGSWSSGAGVTQRQVFVDLNGDNVLESGEPTAVTDSTGTATLSLAGVTSSTVEIGEVLPDGVGQTVPNSYEQSITVASPSTVSFGNLSLTAIPNTDGSGSNPANYDQYGFGNLGSHVVKQAVTQPDGKLVVTASDGSSTVVARYFADGEADKNFSGPDGVVTSIGSFSGSSPAGLVVEPNGYIVVALNNGGTIDMVRIDPTGAQASFATYNGPSPAVARGLALMVDGSLLLTTYITQSGLPDKVEVFNLSSTTGQINTGFAPDGGFGFCPYTPPENGYSQNAASTVVTTVTASGGFAMVMSDFGSGDSTDTGDVYYSYHSANGDHVSTNTYVKIDSAIASELQIHSNPDFLVQAITSLSNGEIVIAGNALSASTSQTNSENNLGIPDNGYYITYAVVVAKITQTGALDTSFGDFVAGTHTGVTYSDDDSAIAGDYGGFESVSDVAVLPNGTSDGNILLTSHVNTANFSGGTSNEEDAFEYCRVFNITGGALSSYNSSSSSPSSILKIKDTYTNTYAVCPLASISGVLPNVTASASASESVGTKPDFVNGSVGFTGAAPPVMMTGNAAADIVLATAPPSASFQSDTPGTITTAGSTASEIIKIKFTDAIALKIKTIRTGNVTVRLDGTAAGMGTIIPTFLGVESGGSSQNAIADYSIPAIGGSWVSADNGTYYVDLLANQVKDAQKFAPAVYNVASFSVNVPTASADTTPPTATFSVIPSITAAGSAPLTVNVTYTDNVAVKLSSIDASDITVAGPGGHPLTVTAANYAAQTDLASITVSYSVAAPAGGWVAADNGTYAIGLVAGAVVDTASTPNPIAAASLGTYTVAVGVPSGLLAPVPDVTGSSTTSVSLSVTYSDSSAPINAATVSKSNLTVKGPGGLNLAVTGAIAGVAVGNQLTVTYSVAAPAGGFQAANNGIYTVALAANQITDTASTLALAATLGNFIVNITSDTAPPTAAMPVAPSVTDAGTAPLTVNVTYTDNVAVNVLSIDISDITVAGPGGTALTVTAFHATSLINAASITVSYTVAAPAGGWTAADNGTYAINLVANAVTDTAATPNAIAAQALGSLVVAVGIPSGLLASVPDITTAGTASVSLSVNYSDSIAPINAASISTANLTVTDPDGAPLNVTGATAGVAFGNQLAVTYTVAAPAGGFQAVNSGTYTIALVAGQITDTAANISLPATLGSFNVDISSTVITSSSVALSIPVANIQTGNVILFTTVVTGSDGGIPTGTVTFLSGTTVLGTTVLNAGAASFSLATLPDGNNSITASYSGDANYAASTSAAQTATVTAAPVGSSALTPTLTRVKLPVAVIGGVKHAISVPVLITNTGGQTASGVVSVVIYASLDDSLDGSAVALTTARHNFKIKAGKGSSLTIKLNGLPALLGNGNYHLLVQVIDASGFAETAVTASTVAVAAPVITPTLSFAKVTLASSILSGTKVRGSVVLELLNSGNVAIGGATTILLQMLPDEASTGTVIKTLLIKRLSVPAGKTAKITVTPGSIPLLATGAYQLVASAQISAANGAAATTTVATDPVVIQVTASVG